VSGRRVVFLAAFAGGIAAQSWELLALLLVLAWAVCAYLWPFGPCWRCKGGKTTRGSTKRRYGLCRSCGGTSGRQVIGSRTVHRAVRSVRKYRGDRKEK